MLPRPQDADTLIDRDPAGFFVGRAHREFCAGRVTRLRNVVRRHDLFQIDRMGKAWWAEPVPSWSKALFASTCFAIASLVPACLADWKRPREAAFTAFHVNTLRFPGGMTVVGHDGVNGSGRVALAGYPHLLTRRVLRQRDGKPLLRRKAHDRTVARRTIAIKHMKSCDVGREGIAGQFAAIKQAVEKLAG